MKKLVIALGLFFAMGLSDSLQAQNISVNVNINLDKQPAWGPVGYDYAQFYYFPDLDLYYDVTNTLFYYLSGGKWTSIRYLPAKYRKYDLYGLYKVVLNAPQPWLQNRTHKKTYSKYKGDRTQQPIRYSSDSKYNSSKNNSNTWVNPNRESNSKNNNSIRNNTDRDTNKNTTNSSNNRDMNKNSNNNSSNSNRNNNSGKAGGNRR